MDLRAENSRRLWNSLEMSVVRRNLTLYSLTVLIVTLVNTGKFSGEIEAVPWILFGVCMAPYWGFYLWRVFRIFRKSEAYAFCRCTLNRPHQAFLRRSSMYFTVLIEEPDGTSYMTDTHAIFACHGISHPLVEDYVNRTVTIGYNKQTGSVVVIG